MISGRDTEHVPTRRGVIAGGMLIAVGGIAFFVGARHGSQEQANKPSASGVPGSLAGQKTASGVVFTTTGDVFRPAVELDAGSSAEVVWVDESDTELARGLEPTIEFGSPGIRHVAMRTTFTDVLTVNIGFNSQDDAGQVSLSTSYDWPAQPVSRITGLSMLTNLRRLLAANGQLAGALDLSGLSRLEHVECYNAQLTNVELTGCASLVRLCVEMNALESLDLNPVAMTLRDLRAAAQKSGHLRFEPLAAPLATLFHFCVRDQPVESLPSAEQLPACEELWIWNTAQDGHFPTPGAARSIKASDNGYSAADFTGKFQDARESCQLDLTSNRLTTIAIPGCSALQSIRLGDNALTSPAVNAIIAEVASWQTDGFELILDGTNGAPTGAALALVEELHGRGWQVSVSPA